MSRHSNFHAYSNPLKSSSLSYKDALERAMGLADFERGSHSPGHGFFHLDRIMQLMERVGDPHLQIPTIHVAGTKGKGSTAAMITSILESEGYKTGLYTSPHLHSVTERIRMGLKPITKNEFSSLVDQLWPEVNHINNHGEYGNLMFFELITAMAFLHFKQAKVDFQVIEVGLGGRLDATNIVHPEVSVITPIMLDHTSVLGDTIPLIAGEKAGIIKPKIPVVVAPQSHEAIPVFINAAKKNQSRLIQVDETTIIRPKYAGTDGQSFELDTLQNTYGLCTPLLGEYQLHNAATAVIAVETLANNDHSISKQSIVDGIANVKWPARMQFLRMGSTRVLLDGAHNPESIKHLAIAVRQYFQFDKLILLFGATRGHSMEGMLNELSSLSPLVVAVQSRHPKSESYKTVSDATGNAGLKMGFSSNDIGVATRWALDLATTSDLILATGSLSVPAEVIEELEGIEPEMYPSIVQSVTQTSI